MRPIRDCLNKQLTDLCQHTVQLEELANTVAQLLPEPYASECQVGSFNKGHLVLTTSDAVWAMQLNYLLPELRDKLRKKLYQLCFIKVIVIQPTKHYKKIIPPKNYTLSEKAKATIISESQQCSYEPLQKALLHLGEG
jgi:hypothetical protein